MSNDAVNIDGNDVVVREDVAKRFRGVRWALLSIGGFVAISAILFIIFFLNSASDGKVEGPSDPRSTESR